jgi:agmatine deiminase
LERAKKMLPPTVELWDLNHDDSWIRDNGPTFILNAQGERGGINWRFNAWGEKYHPYDADDRLASLILQKMKVRRFDAPLVLEGGSIHVDGEGTLLTTEECLLAKNRNPHLSKERIEAYLRSYLGVSKILWLDRGLFGDETDGHVDNVACFVRPSVVAMQVAQDAASPNYGNTQKNLDRLRHERDASNRPLEVVPIPEPPERFCRGERLTLSYINFYPVTGALIVPVFGLDGSADLRRSDDRALGILRELYSDRKIVPIDGMKIIKGGGNVHCITQQIPAPVPPGGMA